MAIDRELLEIIVCPKCKGDLIYDENRDILICKTCSVYYPIREDIPILLIEEAQSFESSEES